MAVTPIAGETHHIVLSDGINSIGLMGCDGQGNPTFDGWRRTPMSRSSMKTSSGETKYSDLEPPYYTVAQERWDGGLGQLRLEDKTMFYSSRRMWTWHKDGLALPSMPCNAQIATSLAYNWDDTLIHQPGRCVQLGGIDQPIAYAIKFTAAASYPINGITIWACRKGGRIVDLFCIVVADDNGHPASFSVYDGTRALADDIYSDLPDAVRFQLNSPYSVTSGSSYWIVIFVWVPSLTPGSYYEIYGAASNGPQCASSTNLTSWTAVYAYNVYAAIYYMVNGAPPGVASPPVACFCHYGSSLYAFTAPKYGSAGKMWLNGDVGVPSGATSNTLTDSTKSGIWAAHRWEDATVVIVEGTGKGQHRRIANNTTTQLTVTRTWDITPDNTSVYVITNTPWWRDVTPTSGDTIDKPVTDVVSAGGYLWIGQGSNQPILRYKAFNNSGTWTVQTADVSGEYAEFMTVHRQGTSITIYKVHFDAPGQVWVVRWATPWTTWNGDIRLSDAVTGMTVFQNIVYVMTDKQVHAIQNNTLVRTDITYSPHEWNGISPTTYNSYLMFPVKSQLARMSGSTIDVVGPDNMPLDRTGHITDMVECGRWLICAYSGGPAKRSTLLLYNGIGWHVLAESGAVGLEMSAVAYQNIPGGPDRVWYAEGVGLKYINVPRDHDGPPGLIGSVDQRRGELITSWFDLSLVTVDKWWNELAVFWISHYWETSIEVYYQTNEDTDTSTWNYLGRITTEPSDTINMAEAGVPACRRIRLKVVFWARAGEISGPWFSSFKDVTPRIIAIALEGVARLKPKHSYSHLCLLVDKQKTLDGREEENSAETILDQLDSWAASATPVSVTTCDPHAPSFHAFVEPVEYRVTRYVANRPADKNEYIIVLNLLEA